MHSLTTTDNMPNRQHNLCGPFIVKSLSPFELRYEHAERRGIEAYRYIFKRAESVFILIPLTCIGDKIGERETEKLHLLGFLDILFPCEFDWGFY
ncbi:hypothetical protein H70357_19235 [Paenibacillus sp. FSL H7-0357]|nr:hypothetical protein H70357_19235 [Paenibacillus sp. FSL H7-0357]